MQRKKNNKTNSTAKPIEGSQRAGEIFFFMAKESSHIPRSRFRSSIQLGCIIPLKDSNLDAMVNISSLLRMLLMMLLMICLEVCLKVFQKKLNYCCYRLGESGLYTSKIDIEEQKKGRKNSTLT
jgi:hypothetical protein